MGNKREERTATNGKQKKEFDGGGNQMKRNRRKKRTKFSQNQGKGEIAVEQKTITINRRRA